MDLVLLLVFAPKIVQAVGYGASIEKRAGPQIHILLAYLCVFLQFRESHSGKFDSWRALSQHSILHEISISYETPLKITTSFTRNLFHCFIHSVHLISS